MNRLTPSQIEFVKAGYCAAMERDAYEIAKAKEIDPFHGSSRYGDANTWRDRCIYYYRQYHKHLRKGLTLSKQETH